MLMRGTTAGIVCAAGMAAVLALPGCGFERARFQQTVTSAAPHVDGTALKVTTRNGAISVLGDPSASEVAIGATLRMTTEARLGEATISATRADDGTLVVTALPPAGGWRNGEGCSFEITVPRAAGVTIESSNGRITLGGLAGDATLTTSNGAIEVNGHDGKVKAKSSNGRIGISGATGPVEARTTNGAVAVTMAAGSEGPLDVRTSNGAITIDLAPSYLGKMSVRTSNGSIRLPKSAPGGGRFVTQSQRRSATMEVGESGESSNVTTSNGSVTIRFLNAM